MLLKSPQLTAIPGLIHGFSTREGGVSSAPWHSLNLGEALGDTPANLKENLWRFCTKLELSGPETLFQVGQVHGNRVQKAPFAGSEQADALFCQQPGVAIAVRTADCLPLLMVACNSAGQAEAVAAVHAGWRGAVGGVIENTLQTFFGAGFTPHQLKVALGPCIGFEAFEVGEEVIEAAVATTKKVPRHRAKENGKWLLDLSDLGLQIVLEQGLLRENIELIDRCTHSDPELFFSHRRDHGKTGRHLSLISISGN